MEIRAIIIPPNLSIANSPFSPNAYLNTEARSPIIAEIPIVIIMIIDIFRGSAIRLEKSITAVIDPGPAIIGVAKGSDSRAPPPNPPGNPPPPRTASIA